jgi:hypothetical protein
VTVSVGALGLPGVIDTMTRPSVGSTVHARGPLARRRLPTAFARSIRRGRGGPSREVVSTM